MHVPDRFFWNQPVTVLHSQLETGPVGLRQDEAKSRNKRFGTNTLNKQGNKSLLLQYLAHFRNPLVIILLTASALSAVTGELAGFVIIWSIVLMSVSLDFIQEYRAGMAADRLRKQVAVMAKVLRDGGISIVPMRMLAPGDIVLLSAGDLIPADCTLLEARDFFVNQSLLTGESYPVEKVAGDLSAPTNNLIDATNAVFMGTSVVSGIGKAMVCRIGKDTEMGNIAGTLEKKPPLTAFERGTHNFGMLIMRVTLLLVLFVFLVNAIFHRSLMESFLFAIALAVGLTPELLPMVVTVTLSRGALRMAKKHVIVKQLIAIQNLGSMDVLCTDKTGTLTEAHIRLVQHVDSEGKDSEEVLRLAYLNSHFETGIKSPLDDAIIEHSTVDIEGWHKIDEAPFDFERRRVSVLLEKDGRRILVIKGSPEDILRLSSHHAPGSSLQPQCLDNLAISAINALHDSLGNEGFKVIGIAWKPVAPDHAHANVVDETELIFAGFAAFLDPPKESAGKAIQALTNSGIAVKIITGDSEPVTRHLCAQLGIPVSSVLNGSEIQQMDDIALAVRVRDANIMCRVTPAQKNRIILALKSQGHTVGYLGDGINDAPSLHSADVGISVNTATDVAKDAAKLIMLRQDLGLLHAGVMEGRRTFANIMKYIMMGTSSNFGNMFSMAGASLFLPFLPMLPVQILLNNLLYDISELPIPMDTVDHAALARPSQWDTGFIRRFMLVIGPVSSAFDILTFWLMLKIFKANESLFQTGWFVESLATQVLVIFIIRTRGNPFKSRPCRLLIVTSISVILIAAFLPFTPIATFLGFSKPPPFFYLLLMIMIVAYLATVQVVKSWFYRRFAGP